MPSCIRSHARGWQRMARLQHLWAERRIILLGFVVALTLLGVFAFRSIAATIYWMDADHQDQPIEGWMTPRYVSMSYDIPPEPLAEALFLRPPGTGAHLPRQNLGQIADAHGVTLPELQERIDQAVAAWRRVDPKPSRD